MLIDDGDRCIDSETGILVMMSLPSNPVVVIVGICEELSDTIFSVPVPVAMVSDGEVVTENGKESVVMFEVAGNAENK